MTTPSVKSVLAEGRVGDPVTVQGWLRTARHSKGLSFLDLTDGSCLAGLQVVAPPELENYESEVRLLGTGWAVRVQGELVESPGKGQHVELRAAQLEVVGEAADDYPLQKKRHSFEYLRTIAHLRPRTNSLGAVFRVRNVAARAIHQFFQERGFVWLHTPILTGADAEGAGEMFEVEGGEAFFGRPTRLTVSGQLEAEIGALALSNVYTFGPTFRAENSNTSRHLAEFWMVEPEMAFCDLRGNAELAESFLRTVMKAILDDCAEDMAFFDERIEKGVAAALEHVVETPFEQMTYTEAVKRLEASGQKFEHPVHWGADLQSEHERWLTEQLVGKPLVVTDYPAGIKAFYMYANDDGKTVRALDVLVPRIGEIIGGSQREHRHDVLKERMLAQGLDLDEYGWYLDLRRFGSVPHAGFGLGFERMVQFATGMANIRDVIPFPRVPGYAEF
ncbi:MAG: asparagine--tRNA ligase [Deltaproteobacteria bacterium]|nr:asparagine--tRNA ligase [Deltaproteobacteria bacterium]MBW2393067.1 asparagine--tRNA ligase [Deltaproteobacteria bacterium]